MKMTHNFNLRGLVRDIRKCVCVVVSRIESICDIVLHQGVSRFLLLEGLRRSDDAGYPINPAMAMARWVDARQIIV